MNQFNNLNKNILLYVSDSTSIAIATLKTLLLLFLLCLIIHFNNKLKRAAFVVTRIINFLITKNKW